MKVCKDCKHASCEAGMSKYLIDTSYYCDLTANRSEPSIITGKARNTVKLCIVERISLPDGSSCGTEGKYWEGFITPKIERKRKWYEKYFDR